MPGACGQTASLYQGGGMNQPFNGQYGQGPNWCQGGGMNQPYNGPFGQGQNVCQGITTPGCGMNTFAAQPPQFDQCKI